MSLFWKGHASIHLKSNREDKAKRYTGKPSRPAYDIASEQIERLRLMGFSWVKIADFMSERTLRVKKAELDISLKYSQITEMQLDLEVQETLAENPSMGRRCSS